MEKNEATGLVNDLFTSWGPFLARYALRMTRSPSMVDDLVQEVFLALYRDLRAGKSIQNPKAWTLGAVRNQIRKQVRDWHRHAEDLVGADVLDLMAAEPRWPDIDAVVDLGPIPTGVLSPREEEVILLRLQSLKYRQIAAILGISDKSVCTLLARALKKLQVASHAPSSGDVAFTERRGGRNAFE